MSEQLHIMFLPFLAQGHMLPMLDTAKLFALRGVKATLITTPLNVHVFEKAKPLVSLQIMKFPSLEAGLPEGIETADQIIAFDESLIPSFGKALRMLQQSIDHILQECHPNCLVADSIFPWSTEVAAKYNIPRLVFYATSPLALCVEHSFKVYKPLKNVLSDSEPFVVPNLPHEIKMIKTQLPPEERQETEPSSGLETFKLKIKEAEALSYGVIFNSFYELQPDYADYYRNTCDDGRRILHLGPVSLCNRNSEDKSERVKKSNIDKQECLKWLDSKKLHSVIYVCFGSLTSFTPGQLHEIAMGLEACGQDFIWVIRQVKNKEEDGLPEGFEERVKGKGFIIKGWAPQVLILEHEAVGGFVTHGGWNSVLEAVSAGVPMVTWPFFADHFYNEKFVTEVLRIGVEVGVLEWSRKNSSGVKREAIEKAVKSLMEGKESGEMRKKAKQLKEAARKAVEEGGSSYSSLTSLIQDLSSNHV